MQSSNEDTFNNYSHQLPIDHFVPQMTRTLNCDTTSTTLSPTNSFSSELSPKNGSIIKKTIRRRSRASKKTPTTHLNADTSNFRALVQQFTGCHTANTFLGAHKGPINLNFGLDENDDFDVDNSNITHVSSFGYDCYCNNPKDNKKVRANNIMEEQKGMLLSSSVHDHENSTIIGSTSTTNSSSSQTMDILNLDDFELENLCLNDFTGDLVTSTDNFWDDGYLLI